VEFFYFQGKNVLNGGWGGCRIQSRADRFGLGWIFLREKIKELCMNFSRLLLAMVLVWLGLSACGCSFSMSGSPRPRLGSYATSTPGTKFLDSNNLGRHCYGSSLFENIGIVYTCRGGHIDIAHLRIAADYTRYLRNKTLKCLMDDKTDLTFRLNVESSTYYVTLAYPENWESLPLTEKQKAAREIALELGQYFTFTMTTWHEVLTYYGYKCMAIVPEQPSAFSWEDIYSNLLGTRLGAMAVEDKDRGYNEAMTALLKEELESLRIQSSRTARDASEKMRGIWFEGFMFINMMERNLDIGTDDGFVTPTLAPDVCENAKPQSYPVPTLDVFNRYGFTMRFEVEPKEFEKDKILSIIYPNGGEKRIPLAYGLPLIVEHIKTEREKKK
jgi:hypothetical protein